MNTTGRQTTHVQDVDGNYRQVVSAKELTRILKREGSSLERPRAFGPDDEWYTLDSRAKG